MGHRFTRRSPTYPPQTHPGRFRPNKAVAASQLANASIYIGNEIGTRVSQNRKNKDKKKRKIHEPEYRNRPGG